jgi:fucose permease
VPGSLALISANFSQKERGRAIGTWSGFTSITAAIGPVLGGWFTEHGSWRWVFFINIDDSRLEQSMCSRLSWHSLRRRRRIYITKPWQPH